jgi:hypothetical protein
MKLPVDSPPPPTPAWQKALIWLFIFSFLFVVSAMIWGCSGSKHVNSQSTEIKQQTSEVTKLNEIGKTEMTKTISGVKVVSDSAGGSSDKVYTEDIKITYDSSGHPKQKDIHKTGTVHKQYNNKHNQRDSSHSATQVKDTTSKQLNTGSNTNTIIHESAKKVDSEHHTMPWWLWLILIAAGLFGLYKGYTSLRNHT